MVRRLLVFVLFIVLACAGAVTSLVSYRNNTALVRGWRSAVTDSPLPYAAPKAGINVDLTAYDSSQLDAELTHLQTAGFVWLRQPFRWSQIESVKDQPDWSKVDLVVAAVRAHSGLRMIAVLDESPAWARKPGGEGSRYAPPASPADFARFAGALAKRYGDAIDHYQVWDEPNLAEHWGNMDVRPAEYAALLRAAYSAIKDADGNAVVIAAGLAPTVETGPRNLNDVDYLHALYENGARDFMDAVSGKPYGFDSSPTDRTVNPAILNFSRIILLREEMERQGDSAKPIFASHFGWNSLPEGWKGPPSIWGQVSAANHERYTRDALNRAAREWPWMAGMMLESWQPNAPADDPLQGFAVGDRIDGWLKNGPLVPTEDGLPVGLNAPTDPRIRYQGKWRFGPLGADMGQTSDGLASVFTTTFVGDSAALQVRRDDYVAYLYITVDGQPANALPRDGTGQAFILLTSPDRKPHMDTIPVARDLPFGSHTLMVRAYLGYERWAIAGIAIGATPSRDYQPLLLGGLLLLLIALVGVVVSGRDLPWNRLPVSDMTGYARRMSDILLGIGVTFAAGISMALTLGNALPNLFRRDEPTLALTILTAGLAYFSPSFLVNAVSIVVLFLIIYNRPQVGPCLVVFFAPFFLYPIQNYIRALPMVELVLVLTVAAVLLRALIDALRRRRQPEQAAAIGFQPRFFDLLMLGFAGMAMLSLAWSEQRAPALRELRIMVIEPILLYFIIRAIRMERRDLLRLVDTLLAAGLAICLLGLSDYFLAGQGVIAAEGGTRRLGSIYGSPNNVALFIGRCTPFALAMVLFPLNRLRRAVAGVILLMMLLTIGLTQSAGALLFGIPAAFAVTLIVWDRRKGALLTVIGVAVLIIGGVIFLPRLQSAFGSGRESSLARVNVWTSAINLIRERPLTGGGLDQFLYLYRSRYILPDAYKEPDLSHPHNEFLDFWVSLGAGGLALFLLLQANFWRLAISAYRRLRDDILGRMLCAGVMGSMADFLAHGLVDNSYFVVDLAYVFCFSVALVMRLNARATVQPGSESRGTSADLNSFPDTTHHTIDKQHA